MLRIERREVLHLVDVVIEICGLLVAISRSVIHMIEPRTVPKMAIRTSLT
jgi:hypothetical protein